MAARPRLYPLHAQLAEAYLAKARLTGEQVWLARARASLARSLAIQPSYEAFLVSARVANYSHRFEEAIGWARQALDARGEDAPSVGALVEAYMGFGRYDEARALLPPEGIRPASFEVAAALALWLAAQGRADQAASAFAVAGELARSAHAGGPVAWAEVMAAGVLIDAGRLQQARSHLETAARIEPASALLHRHEGELLEREGRAAAALAVYEGMLEIRSDPAIHRRAFLVARRLGDGARARGHFAAAEQGFQAAIDAGEVYTLGALAQLYGEADVKLELAVELARRNLDFKRDREAQATLAFVLGRLP